MGFMQVYRVGTTGGEAALGKISRLLTGEGIDSEDLGRTQPENGCVLIDLNTGEDNVRQVVSAVPQLPHILVTSTAALGSRQLDLCDECVSPDLPDQEIVARHPKFLKMLERLRKPDDFRELSTEESALDVLFVGDRNVGNALRTKMSDAINLKTQASTAGGITEAIKHDAVLIQLGGKEDAKERFTFLQVLIKAKEHPALALLFLKTAPDQFKSFCEKNGVALIETGDAEEVQKVLTGLSA